ncbi:MAG: ATP-binding cassette domain-containing protein [Kiritimatiellae bacterium]|nr:ATP-binding cassette domain-containing protein [Kiritimatiellia bacterium]
MIKAEHLTKRFASAKAVDDVSFEVLRGEIIGFLGPNGAGKTTLMRLLSTYLAPTQGRILIDGLDIFVHSLDARRRIGYLPEHAPLYPEMRVDEYLSFRAKLKGMPRRKRRERMEEMKVLCGLKDVERRIIGQLSKGYGQRLALADSLINSPELLILDEPTIGLDPNQICAVRELIRTLGRRFTVVLATHSLADAEAICQRVFIMNHGRIVASDSPERLVGQLQGNARVAVEIAGPSNEVSEQLRRISGVLRVLPVGHVFSGPGSSLAQWRRYRLECSPGTDIRPAVFGIAAAQGWPLRELSMEVLNLEDVFSKLTTSAGRGQTLAAPSEAGKPSVSGQIYI